MSKQAEEDDNCPDLSAACRKLRLHPVKKFLLNGCNPSVEITNPGSDEHGFTPLHLVMDTWSGLRLSRKSFRLKIRAKIIKLLLLFGANVCARDSQGNTPLHIAAKLQRSRLGTIIMLVRYGARFDIENNRGQTAFEILLQHHGMKKEIQFFIYHGVTMNGMNVISSKSYLAIALERCHLHEVQDIIQSVYGCLDIDNAGRNLIQSSVFNLGLSVQVSDYFPTIRNCIRIGIDIDHRDNYGMTALNLAVKMGNGAAMKALTSLGCDVDNESFKFIRKYSSLRETCQIVLHDHFTHLLGFNTCSKELYEDYQESVVSSEIDDHFLVAVEKTKKIRIGPVYLYDFISGSAITAYSNFNFEERKRIDSGFENLIFVTIYKLPLQQESLAEDLQHLLTLILQKQYSKARSRFQEKLKMTKIASNLFDSFVGFFMPNICKRMILEYLAIHDLTSFVHAAASSRF